MVVNESAWWPVAWLKSSSKFSLVSPMTFLNCIFVDMTAASYQPLKCGDLSGMNFTVCSVHDAEICDSFLAL